MVLIPTLAGHVVGSVVLDEFGSVSWMKEGVFDGINLPAGCGLIVLNVPQSFAEGKAIVAGTYLMPPVNEESALESILVLCLLPTLLGKK